MTDPSLVESAWRRFWNRDGWWRAVLLAVVYIAAFLGISALTSTLFSGMIDAKSPTSNGVSIFFGFALPVLLGAALLLLFIWSAGWWHEIFGRQPIKGSGWMWIAVALVLVPIVIHLSSTRWGELSAGVIVAYLVMGLGVGAAEELLTRGLAVNLLRKAGYGEKAVMVLSSVIFALLHMQNMIGGQPPLLTLLELPYTFGFGLMMYLVLRVTGSIIWPILLHAATDPTTALSSGSLGGLGEAAASASSGPLLLIASMFGYVFLVAGLIMLFFVKGRVHPRNALA